MIVIIIIIALVIILTITLTQSLYKQPLGRIPRPRSFEVEARAAGRRDRPASLPPPGLSWTTEAQADLGVSGNVGGPGLGSLYEGS